MAWLCFGIFCRSHKIQIKYNIVFRFLRLYLHYKNNRAPSTVLMQFTYYSISIVFYYFFRSRVRRHVVEMFSGNYADKNAHKIELQLLEIIFYIFDSAHQNVWGYLPGCIVVIGDPFPTSCLIIYSTDLNYLCLLAVV